MSTHVDPDHSRLQRQRNTWLLLLLRTEYGVLGDRPRDLIFKRPDHSRFEIEGLGHEHETYEGLAQTSMVLTDFFELDCPDLRIRRKGMTQN